jgi:hypothetical protein
MTAPLPLAELQRWMLAAITDPAGAAAGPQLDDVILPSRQQSPAERLAVYSSAYFARLLEVLRELFPCLRYAVGEELFDQFASEYLQAHPPASYTLHRLADRFPEFLEATRPADDDSLAFIVDLARLEHAIDQVFDGPGPETESAAGGDPAAGVALVPGLVLLKFRFPASTYFTAWKAGQQPAWPAPGEQYLALLRRDYIVRRHELTPVQFQLLSSLSAGHTLEESLAAIAPHEASIDASIDELAEDVRRWFTHWAASGLLVVPAAR